MTDLADSQLAEIAASERVAVSRAISRLSAPDQALRRHGDLSRRGELGQGMSLPQIEQRVSAKRPQQVSEAAKVRNQSLARQANPLADREPQEPTRTNEPTPQRKAAIDTALETYATTIQAGRRIATEALRVVPVVEHMRGRGHLGEAEERAAQRFYTDFVVGHRVGGLVSSIYSGGSSGGGYEGSGEIRTEKHRSFIDACRAINHLPTVEWMVRIICEHLMAAETKVPTLADAGRAYMGYKNVQQAQAVGATLLKTGLERLVIHYERTGGLR